MKKLLVASALLCCASSAMAQAARTDRAAVANGESVYLRVGCQACHGTVGHGGAAPRLAPNTLPLPGFETWVRNGTPGWTSGPGCRRFRPPSSPSRARGHPHVSGEPAAAPSGGRYSAAGALEAPIRPRLARILHAGVCQRPARHRLVPAPPDHVIEEEQVGRQRVDLIGSQSPLQPEWYAAIDVIPIGPDALGHFRDKTTVSATKFDKTLAALDSSFDPPRPRNVGASGLATVCSLHDNPCISLTTATGRRASRPLLGSERRSQTTTRTLEIQHD